jgi:hypothetical protein
MTEVILVAFGVFCEKISLDVFKYRSFATTVLQLKMFDFSGETFKGFEVL